jgi:hybrid cluster-associated redox disulfide protein
MEQIPLPTPKALGEMIITDVLERWPNTADVFHNHAMACVGCAVAPFYTINDAALVYRLPADNFVAELLAVIQTTRVPQHE